MMTFLLALCAASQLGGSVLLDYARQRSVVAGGTSSTPTPTTPTGRVFYISTSGSDSANGTTKGTAWAHCPYMSAFTGSYTHQAGDAFIFKGGETWGNTIVPTAGGSAGNPDLYSFDPTWYSGSSWTKPKIDVERGADYCFGLWNDPSYVVIEGFELVGMHNPTRNNGGGIRGYDPAHLTIKSCHIHDWTAATGTDGSFGGINFNGPGANSASMLIEDTEISNAENGTGSGNLARMVGTMRRCVLHHNSSAVLYALDFDGGTIHNINGTANGPDADGQTYHTNVLYCDPNAHSSQTVGHIRNSTFYDNTAGTPIYPNPKNATVYVYNTLTYGSLTTNGAILVDPYKASGGTTGTCLVYNNTIALGTAMAAIQVTDRTGGSPAGKLDVLTIRNTHVIGPTGSTVTSANSTTVQTLTTSDSLVQTAAEAATDGASSPTYRPTTFTNGYDTSATVTTDIRGVSRSAPVKIGAYQQ